MVRRPSLRRVVAPLLLAAAATAISNPGAAAQPTTCPTPRDAVATVAVAAPEAGATVGGRVEVRGRVESPSALFQVELFVGDSRKDVAYFSPPAEAADFVLGWDATLARGGPSTLRVVACGGSADGGSLVSGTGTVEVQVEPSAGPTSTKVLVDTREPRKRETRSLAAGAAIAVPAVACLIFAVGRRRRT